MWNFKTVIKNTENRNTVILFFLFSFFFFFLSLMDDVVVRVTVCQPKILTASITGGESSAKHFKTLQIFEVRIRNCMVKNGKISKLK